jgi:diacylglycerol kinase (ATP)
MSDAPGDGGGKPGATGVTRIARALGYSLAGLAAAYRHEPAFRQLLWLAAVLIPVAFFAPVGALARALMIASVLLVLIVELLNSAIEAAVDLASPARHELAGRAKDIGSAASLVAQLGAAAVWLLALFG